jgi:hypothetical protein
MMTLDEITGGSRLPRANELQGTRYQSRKIAKAANKLPG